MLKLQLLHVLAPWEGYIVTVLRLLRAVLVQMKLPDGLLVARQVSPQG